MATLDDIRAEQIMKARKQTEKRRRERFDEEDARIRERLGGKHPFEATIDRTGSRELVAQRDRQQGFEGDEPITPDLLDMVDKDIADIGRPKPATLEEYARRINAQFPSEPSPYKASNTALALTLTQAASVRAARRERDGSHAE